MPNQNKSNKIKRKLIYKVTSILLVENQILKEMINIL